MDPVRILTLPLPVPCREEVLRYAGAKTESPSLTALLDQVLAEGEDICSGSVCWRQVSVLRQNGQMAAGTITAASHTLEQKLAGCDTAIVFAATIGIGIDRQITRYGKLSPAKALLWQALGAERIEALCDEFCRHMGEQLRQQGFHLLPRFSPGYGDLPLNSQQALFSMLDCSRHIGLTLNESMLMSPSKSVTAIMGLSRTCPGTIGSGCSACSKTDCIHRRHP